MFFQSSNRFVAYTESKQKVSFRRAYSTLRFTNSTVPIPGGDTTRESFTLPAAVVEQGIAIGYRLLQEQLEKRKARFVYEDHQRATNLQAGSHFLPKITYASYVYPEEQKRDALRVTFEPLVVRGTGAFVYQLTSLHLTHARAKTSAWSDVFDYTFQLNLHFLKDGKLTERALKPMVVQSVTFGAHDLTELQLCSSPILLEDRGLLVEASLTVVETNPAQVNTGRVLELLTEHKKDITTLLADLLTPK